MENFDSDKDNESESGDDLQDKEAEQNNSALYSTKTIMMSVAALSIAGGVFLLNQLRKDAN